MAKVEWYTKLYVEDLVKDGKNFLCYRGESEESKYEQKVKEGEKALLDFLARSAAKYLKTERLQPTPAE